MRKEAGTDPESVADDEQEVEPVRVLMASPVGRLALEFRGTAVVSLIIQPERKDARHYKSLNKIQLTDFLMEALGRLSEYLASVRSDPDLEIDLEPSQVSGFALRVLRQTLRIPHGRTWTYTRLAEAAGRPGAYRLVQAALAQNPIPILIPCHRVIPSKGGVGAYIAGTKKKEKLLKIEAQILG